MLRLAVLAGMCVWQTALCMLIYSCEGVIFSCKDAYMKCWLEFLGKVRGDG